MPRTNTSPGAAVLAPIFAGTFIALLDLSIVIVALPTIQSELHTNVAGAQWVVDAFVLPLGALRLSGGALGDRYGRKRIFLGALALFLAGSVICATAATLGVLLAGRVVQGIATAAILPGALSLVTQLEPDPQRRADWDLGDGQRPVVLGPLVGGAFVDTLGWQAIFYVNVPIVLAAIAVGTRTITESADPDHASLDPMGQLAAAGARPTHLRGDRGTQPRLGLGPDHRPVRRRGTRRRRAHPRRASHAATDAPRRAVHRSAFRDCQHRRARPRPRRQWRLLPAQPLSAASARTRSLHAACSPCR
jgi:MFS family permease